MSPVVRLVAPATPIFTPRDATYTLSGSAVMAATLPQQASPNRHERRAQEARTRKRERRG